MYRTVLAPAFLLDDDRQHVLAESTGTGGADADGTRVVELHDARVGLLSIGYDSMRVRLADIDPTAPDGDDVLTDEHGRPLEIVFGIVSRDVLLAPLHPSDMSTVLGLALDSYRRFLDDEEGHRVDTAPAFTLRTAVEPRDVVPAPRVAIPASEAGTIGREAGPPRARRRRPGIVAAGAAAIGAMLVAVGTLILAAAPDDPRLLTVYSSLPLQGPQRARAEDIVRGIRLALAEAGGRAGRLAVRYASLDASSVRARGWEPGAVRRNARRAADDDATAAYIGDLSSAASALSIPILSGAKVAQISPSNTAVGLTTDEPGARDGEPQVHYKAGFRNYVRIVPRDTVQGRALVTALRQDGCRRVALVHDRDGDGVAQPIERSTRAHGVRLVLDAPGASRSAASRRSLAARAAERRADCVVVAVSARNEPVALLAAIGEALPRARLYGFDGLADGDLAGGALGRLAAGVADRVKLTLPTVGRAGLGVQARPFYRALADRYPGVRRPDPYAIYGYEAMRLALDAITRSGSGDRKDIVTVLFDTRDRRSVIGTYSIDPNGDTTLTDCGLFAIRKGELVFERTINAS